MLRLGLRNPRKKERKERKKISLRDGLVIDVFFVCEFKGSSCAPGGWNNGVRHTNDVLQARANVKNNKYKDVYGLVAQGVCTCHRRYVRSDPR